MRTTEIYVNDEKMPLIMAKPSLKQAHDRIRITVTSSGHDWLTSSVFVPNYPEKGRHLSKAPGFATMQAGG